MTLATILVIVLAIVIAGGSGNYIAYRFHKTEYSKTDTSGDFGTPRGGPMALMSGCLIGMLFFAVMGRFNILPADTIGVGMITAMIAGFAGGIIGLFSATRKQK